MLKFKEHFNNKITFNDVMKIINKLKSNKKWKWHTASGNCGIFAFMLNDLYGGNYPIAVILPHDADDSWWENDATIYHVALAIGNNKYLDGFGIISQKDIENFCMNVYGVSNFKIETWNYSDDIKSEIRNNTNFYTNENMWLDFFIKYKNTNYDENVLVDFLDYLDKAERDNDN